MVGLEALFSWQLIFVCLAIYALVYVIRTIVEGLCKKYNKDLNKSVVWTSIFLPTSGIIIGGLFGLVAVVFPWPLGLTALTNRVIFGIVCGLLSSFVYSKVKSFIKDKKDIVTDIAGVVGSNESAE